MIRYCLKSLWGDIWKLKIYKYKFFTSLFFIELVARILYFWNTDVKFNITMVFGFFLYGPKF